MAAALLQHGGQIWGDEMMVTFTSKSLFDEVQSRGGMPVPWPDNVVVVIGGVENVMWTPILQDDENADDENADDDAEEDDDVEGNDDNEDKQNGNANRMEKKLRKASATKDLKDCSNDNSFTDLTIESDQDSIYDVGIDCVQTTDDVTSPRSDTRAMAMAARIAQSLEPRKESNGGRLSIAANASLKMLDCCLCDRKITSQMMITSCYHCGVMYHAACLANAMLEHAPPSRLLPYSMISTASNGKNGNSPFACHNCSLNISWWQAVEEGLGLITQSRQSKKRKS